jgi:hypothetical protein
VLGRIVGPTDGDGEDGLVASTDEGGSVGSPAHGRVGGKVGGTDGGPDGSVVDGRGVEASTVTSMEGAGLGPGVGPGVGDGVCRVGTTVGSAEGAGLGL